MSTQEQQERWAAEGRPPVRDRLKSRKRATTRIVVCMEPDLVDRLDKAEQALATHNFLAEGASTPGVVATNADDRAALEAEVDAAKAAVAEAEVDWMLRGLGRKDYDDLLTEHAPTKEQNEEHQRDHGSPAPYNGLTFPPALVHACTASIDGEETPLALEDVVELFDEWNGLECIEIFTAALELCNRSRVRSLGNV